MASTSAEEAVLVVRIWREPGVTGFRGRVTYRADVSDTAEAVVVIDSAEQLQAAVQRWLDAFVVQNGPRE
jgi:hypothetical protein